MNTCIYIYIYIYIYEVYAKSALIDPKNGTLNLRKEILNMISLLDVALLCPFVMILCC